MTIARPSHVETKVKGSRFIARTSLASSTDDANRQLRQISKQEHAATHNCFAYLVGVPGEEKVFKYSDDGEPSGTAGRPIYDIICGSGITNVVVVVTRYFGGVKLGTGGLVRAYAGAAKEALEKSGQVEKFVTDLLRVSVDFPVYDNLLKVLHKLGAHPRQADFSERVVLELEIRRSKSELLVAEITKLSMGQARIEQI